MDELHPLLPGRDHLRDVGEQVVDPRRQSERELVGARRIDFLR
jgi:hypothetical protein